MEQRMNWRMAAFCMLFACRLPPVDSEPIVDVQLNPPDILTFTLECDPVLERWQLDVEASSWTGGGEWWWTTDRTYVESHQVNSRKAAQDGSFDELRLRLDIVADWRDAERNRTTAFLCSSTPTGRFVLKDLDGAPVDCHDEGNDVDWLMNEALLPDCP